MNAQTKESGGISLRAPFIIVTSLFFMWGFITVMVDALIPRLKDVFELTFLQAGMVQFAWFAAYGLISIPGGNLIERIGYKRGILTGLGLASLGCLLFYPAAATRMYPLFLLALFVVAGGITILQVAANPYISVLGSPEKASSRLNLAQAFNSLGTTIAPIVAASFLLSDKILNSDEQSALTESALDAYRAAEASAVQGPFVALAVAFGVLALLMGMSKLPRILGGSSRGGYGKVLQNKRLVYGAIGIFVYVGAEVAIGSYMVNYGLELGVDQIIRDSAVLSSMASLAASIGGKSLAGMDTKGLIGALLTFYWGGAMIGRFIGSAVMNRMAPQRLLGFFALCAAAMTILS
ncbi:MFS transporter, partial [Flavobacteriales bacterium]|nr:MFS transporter [Flavobacteriales bacterium]